MNVPLVFESWPTLVQTFDYCCFETPIKAELSHLFPFMSILAPNTLRHGIERCDVLGTAS